MLRFRPIFFLGYRVRVMWREYFEYAGTLLAVVNGLIAIIIALMPMRRSVLKLRLAVAALVLGALAVGATFYSKYSAYVRVERQQSDRAEVSARLENLTSEGRNLLGQIRDANRALPTAAADEWAQRTEIFLRDRLGEPSIARFRKDADALYGDATGVAASRMGYWRAVRNRIVNLELIGAEFTDQQRLQ